MTYIYDIILNFQDKYYDFFEWDSGDNIMHIRKIPLIRVSDKDFNILKYNKVKIAKEIINSLKNKTIYYGDKRSNNTNILVSNKKQALGLSFNSSGDLVKRSSLLFDESEEVEEETVRLSITKIIYEKNELITDNIISRIMEKEKKEIEHYLHKLTDEIILKYLYYDIYEKECNNINRIKEKLLTEKNSKLITKLYNTIKLLNNNSKKLVKF